MLSFYWHLVCRYLITAFDLTSACYDLILFVVLLRRFIYVGAIQIDKIDLISQIYQIMVVSILKKLSLIYSSYYNIKFTSFLLIYYAINLDTL